MVTKPQVIILQAIALTIGSENLRSKSDPRICIVQLEDILTAVKLSGVVTSFSKLSDY